VDETFIIPSKTAPTSRAVIEDYLKRSGLDIIPAHEVDNITHAVVHDRVDRRRSAQMSSHAR
jgi:LysR family transcriptional regulator, hca operon transcriptional activator